MDGFELDEITEVDAPRGRAARSKPVKRKWREIELLKTDSAYKKNSTTWT